MTVKEEWPNLSLDSIALILLSDRHLRPDLRRIRYTGGKGDGSKSVDEKAAVPVANLALVGEGWMGRTTRNCHRYASTRFSSFLRRLGATNIADRVPTWTIEVHRTSRRLRNMRHRSWFSQTNQD